MMRDVRAVAYSLVDRIKYYNSTDYIKIFSEWDSAVKSFKKSCEEAGPDSCMIVFYEHLVLNKTVTLKKITKFLDLPWSDSMLSHEKYIGERVPFSEVEWSTSQIKQATYTDSVNAWVGKIPEEALKELATSAPILQELGYDPMADNSYNQTPI